MKHGIANLVVRVVAEESTEHARRQLKPNARVKLFQLLALVAQLGVDVLANAFVASWFYRRARARQKAARRTGVRVRWTARRGTTRDDEGL